MASFDYTYILLVVSLFLSIAIFISIMFGCAFVPVEKFTTKGGNMADPTLSNFENYVLDGIATDTIDSAKIQSLINDGSLKKENIDKMIMHIEKLKKKENKETVSAPTSAPVSTPSNAYVAKPATP